MLLQTELDFDLETNSVAQKKSLFGSGGGSSLTPTVVVLTSHKKNRWKQFCASLFLNLSWVGRGTRNMKTVMTFKMFKKVC